MSEASSALRICKTQTACVIDMQVEYPKEELLYSQPPRPGQRGLPTEEPNLPKIRVVVRKRPLNQKVLFSCIKS